MASYNFFDNSTNPPTERGTLTATFHNTSPATLSDVFYSNNGGHPFGHADITLTGPDGNGNYSANKHLDHDFSVTGHAAHRHITFTFNPNNGPAGTFTGHLDDNPGKDDGFSWSASSDGTHSHKK